MCRTNKIFVLAIFLILMCCVGAASASDIGADDSSGGLSVDESSIIEEVNVYDGQEDISDDNMIDDIAVADEKDGGAKGNIASVDNLTYNDTFETDGSLKSTFSASALSFSGSFSNMPFDNFIINSSCQ